jgi:two-component system OmpR family response regulator
LITEDDRALAEALQFSMRHAGYAVDCVSNGADADEALKGEGFELLILDLGLPKLDGFEVLRRLRRRNTTLPVLILSGRERPEEKVTGLDLGADDYLVKPFSLASCKRACVHCCAADREAQHPYSVMAP